MNILVTGGAGYKGSILVNNLLNKGHKVTIYDNFMYGYNSIINLASHTNCRIIKKDIRDIQKTDVKDFEIIIHLAAISGLPACRNNPTMAKSINYQATKRLVKLLSKNQIIIFASTTSLYGVSKSICDENSKLKPLSLYGQTKILAEKVVLDHPSSIVFRFATLFGISPRMRTELLVNNFVFRALNERSIVIFDPLNVRTFLHVEDALAAYLFAIKKFSQMKGNIYNVGTNKLNFSKLELAQKIQKHVDFQIFESNISDVDQRNFTISYDKITKLGYKTTRTIESGIQELIKLYSFYSPSN